MKDLWVKIVVLLFVVMCIGCEKDDPLPTEEPLIASAIIYERSGSLYIMNFDGRDTAKYIEKDVNLSFDPDSRSPLSPTRSGLVAKSSGNLYLFTKGNMEGQLISNNTGEYSWSPNGNRLLFFKELDSGKGKLYNYDMASNQQQEIPSPLQYYKNPQWIDDQTLITHYDDGAGQTSLARIDLNSGQISDIDIDIEYSTFRISNDKERLLFNGYETQGERGLFLTDLNGNGIRLLSQMDIRRIYDWSPDDSKVLVATNSAGQDAWNVFSVDVNTGVKTNLSGLTSPVDKAWHPSWSADGSEVVFSLRDATGARGYDLYKANADGTGLTNLTNYDPPMSGHYNAVWVK